MHWISILGNVSIWIVLLPLLLGVCFFSKLNKESKLITLIVFIGAIPQVLKSFIENTPAITILYNLYTPLEFLIYWFIFKEKISSVSRKKVLDLMLFLFCIISFWMITYFGLAIRFLNEWVIVNNIFQLVWICIYLLEYYYSEDNHMNYSQPFFWFLIAITGYASCTAVFYSLWYFIKNNPNRDILLINLIHHIFNILLYLFFSIGLLLNFQKTKRLE